MNTNKLNKVYRAFKETGAIVVPEGEKLSEKNLETMETWAKDSLRSYDLLLKYNAISVEKHAAEVEKVSVLLGNISKMKEGECCTITRS